jgi:hypothetical protein
MASEDLYLTDMVVPSMIFSEKIMYLYFFDKKYNYLFYTYLYN